MLRIEYGFVAAVPGLLDVGGLCHHGLEQLKLHLLVARRSMVLVGEFEAGAAQARVGGPTPLATVPQRIADSIRPFVYSRRRLRLRSGLIGSLYCLQRHQLPIKLLGGAQRSWRMPGPRLREMAILVQKVLLLES